MLKYAKRLGLWLSLNHQWEWLLMLLVVVAIVSDDWWSVAGLGLYAIMQFQYRDTGTFQRALRDNDKPATTADLLYVLAGLGGLILIGVGMARRIVEVMK